MSAGSVKRGSKHVSLSSAKPLKDQPKSASSPVPEESTKVSQRTLDRTRKERDEVKKSLDATLSNCARLNQTIYNITKKVIDTFNRPPPFAARADIKRDPKDVSEEELLQMIGRLVPVEQNISLEGRLEEVETRITLLNSELGKLLKLKMSVEDRLKELETCRDLQAMQQAVQVLWLQSCSTKLFVKDSVPVNDSEEIKLTGGASPYELTTVNSFHLHLPPSVQINMQRVDITPPSGKKLAGETHIRDIETGLIQLVVQELSLCKANGCDWRIFAQRVGISEQTVKQWQEMKLFQPMRNVLAVWAKSPAATVRMLHRHLVSPQMRCVVLGKRISDYYKVD